MRSRSGSGTEASTSHALSRAGIAHDGEIGQAGYYKVRLTDYGGIDAEATALTRAAAERYTFTATGEGHVLVNIGQANERHAVTGSTLTVVGDRAVEGKLRADIDIRHAIAIGIDYLACYGTAFRGFLLAGKYWVLAAIGLWLVYLARIATKLNHQVVLVKVDYHGHQANFIAQVQLT